MPHGHRVSPARGKQSPFWIQAWMERIRQFCVEKEADYVAVATDTPYDRALLEYLSKRARLH